MLTNLGSQVRLVSQECITVDKYFLTGLKSNEYPFLSEICLKDDQIPCHIKGMFLLINI